MTGSVGTASRDPGAPVPTAAPPRWYAITGPVVAALWVSGLVLGSVYYIWAMSGME